MLSEMEEKMKELEVDAFIIYTADGMPNQSLRYLTGDIPHSGAFYVKAKGMEPVVVLEAGFEEETFAKNSMIKDIRTLEKLGLKEKREAYGGDIKPLVYCLDEVLKSLNITYQTRIKWYDLAPVAVVDGLRELGYKVSPVVDNEKSLVGELSSTKDDRELGYIAANVKSAEFVLGRLYDFLRSYQIKDGKLTKDGKDLVIGDVKIFVRTECLKENLSLEEPAGLVFSQADEAANPHSQGTDSRPVLANTPTVIDFFPKSTINKYFADITRTIVIGKASEEVKRVYNDVLEAQRLAENLEREGMPVYESMERVCDFFNSKGYKTYREDPKQREGFIHSLGHGIGLNMHEEPTLRIRRNVVDKNEKLKAGSVFTNEPGLYFPGKFGIRIEDDLVCTKGGVINLTMFPKDLEILPNQ